MTVPTAAFDYAQAAGQRQARAAVKDGQMAGFAILTAQPGCLLLDNVAVLPAAQGRGIGAWLLALAKEQARGIGLGETWFCTNEGMTENLAYYTRHGYAGAYRAEQDGFHRVFYRKLIDQHPTRGMSGHCRRRAVRIFIQVDSPSHRSRCIWHPPDARSRLPCMLLVFIHVTYIRQSVAWDG